MASFKLSMDSRRAQTHERNPIVIRLTHKGQSTSISTNVKLTPNEWDQAKGKVTKAHPDFKTLNIHLKNRLLSLEKKALELPSTFDGASAGEFKDALLNKKKVTDITFKEFASKEIQTLRDQERFGNAKSYEAALNRLTKFTGNALPLNKINYTLICDFEAHLLKDGLTKNSVAVYMREVRALLNKAIKKDLLDKATYPFNKYIIKGEKTVSRAITKDDLEKIRCQALIAGSKLWHSRNIFFLIFNLIGISFIDLALLTNDSIQNRRIVYRRRKTGKIYSIKLTAEAESLLNFYRGESKYLISSFNLDSVSKQDEIEMIHQKLKVCNKYLKDLGKLVSLPIPLTTYVARYSWANIAKASGYSKDLIAEALGHEYGNAITGIYLDSYGDEVIDGVNEKVNQFQNELI